MSDAPIAILDVGSNSIRLLLWSGSDDFGPKGERITTVTGLRRGAGADGTIASDALNRLDVCVESYAARMRAAGVSRGVALGTSAVRDAPNRDAVAEIIGARLGLALTVISGTVEARLSYAGARLTVHDDGPVIVLDVGGGSTEVVRGHGSSPTGAVSLQMGAVRSTEDYLFSDPPTQDQLDNLREDAEVASATAITTCGGAAPIVAVSGTASTLAAIDIGRYDPKRVHGHVLTRAAVEEMLSWMSGLSVADRAGIPGLEPARAPVIVAGAMIVAAAMSAAGVDDLRVSERDLLDGAASFSPTLVGSVGIDGPCVTPLNELV